MSALDHVPFPTISAFQFGLFGGEEEIKYRKRAGPRVATVAVAAVPPDDWLACLDLPLFSMDIGSTAILSEADERAIEALDTAPATSSKETMAVALAAEDDMPIEWEHEGILQLHSILLEESLRALAGTGNAFQKKEILDWIFECDFVGEVEVGGVKKRIKNQDCVLSFAFCCKLEGMDPDRIRGMFRKLLPQAVAHYFF